MPFKKGQSGNSRGRPPRLKPTPDDLALWPVLLARDPKSPSGLVWRDRPRSLFRLEPQWVGWTVKWAWKPAGTLKDGRYRVTTGGAKGRKFLTEDIVAALEAMGDDTLRSDADALTRAMAEHWPTYSKAPDGAQAQRLAT
jgi:hypothetical protein